MSEVWVAEYASAHYTFRAAASTPGPAMEALIRGLKWHGWDRHLADDWFDVDDINTYRIGAGVCLRDDTPLTNVYTD